MKYILLLFTLCLDTTFAFYNINQINHDINRVTSRTCSDEDIIYPTGYVTNESSEEEKKIRSSIDHHNCSFTSYSTTTTITAAHCVIHYKPDGSGPYILPANEVYLRDNFKKAIIKISSFHSFSDYETKNDYAILCDQDQETNQSFVDLGFEKVSTQAPLNLYGYGKSHYSIPPNFNKNLVANRMKTEEQINQEKIEINTYDSHIQKGHLPFLQISNVYIEDNLAYFIGATNNHFFYDGTIKVQLTKGSYFNIEIQKILNNLKKVKIVKSFSISKENILTMTGYFSYKPPGDHKTYQQGVSNFGDSGGVIIQNGKILGILVAGTSFHDYYIDDITKLNKVSHDAFKFLNNFFSSIKVNIVEIFNHSSTKNFLKACSPSCQQKDLTEECKKQNAMQIHLNPNQTKTTSEPLELPKH